MRLGSRLTWTGVALAALVCVGCDGGDAPAAPSVDALPEVTNQNPLTVTGSAESGALVQIRVGSGSPTEGTAGDDGAFSIDVTLNAEVENTLLVSQTVGGVESEATMVTVTHDGTPPNAPQLDPIVTPTRRSMQRLRGQSEAGATITVTGGTEDAEATADADGRFEVTVSLATSDTMAVDNAIAVVATDVAGNEGPATDVTIVYDPTLPLEAPVLDDFPGFTNSATITLTGEAEAGVGISAVGAGTDGMTTVGDDGTFSVEIGLRPNQRNEVLLFAVAGGETSAAASAVIVHDDVAPNAPSLDPQASPTGAETIRMTGEAEPGATVDVTGGMADASGAADDEGFFSVDVMLNLDTDNTLSVTATDPAGNASDPTELMITQDSSLEEPVIVDPVSSPTSDPTVTLTGRAQADSAIEITGGADTVSAMSDASGDWTAMVTLRANTRNELRITRPGSGVDTIVTIEHDDVAPMAPELNDLASPTGNTTIDVTGTSEPRARISVSGGVMPASGTAGMDGRFSVPTQIAEDSETTLSVIATDRAGNSSAPSMATVTHSSSTPPAPRVDQANPAPTNMPTHVVTGRVEMPGAGIEIVIRGGMAEATGPTDPSSGTFSVEVTLNPNTENTLMVVSREGSIESPATPVTITHDDIAPATPNASNITASAGGCVLGVPTGGNVSGMMMSVEARSTVRVENVTRSTSATSTATDAGSFNVSLGACNGDVMRVTASDAAGNTSDFVEVNAS
ncbi:MAG: Ig-like domain-containing protein [Myxococcota bacterium]|nr:Ig-like domain-containing protein [Myxococcota bacterium]